jgi:tyrosine decarboxylase/aspartate 1-decarboxylase
VHETGWSTDRVRRALAAARARDHRFRGGAILGSMCTAPHPLAVEAHARFAETNLGDPEHFPGTAALEADVLRDCVALVHGGRTASARLLTGGTEANLYALYMAREITGRRGVVAPEHAHFSFHKAARLLGMDVTWVPDYEHRADVDGMSAAVTADTAVVVAVAGTTELGRVDDVAAIARSARGTGARVHVDAAFGGYVLPFLDQPPRFDLAVAGVDTVSLDPHKGGMATIPAGVLVTRRARDWDAVAVATPYVSTASQAQLLGTRPGAAAAATWAVHRRLGRSGYRRAVAACLRTTRVLADGIERRGCTLVAPPELNVVTFRPPRGGAAALSARLHARGFRLNVVPRFDALRIVINPHVTRAAAQRFLAALEAVA